MSETTIPALPSSLSSLVLSHIVPSLSVPLPPDCLATPLLQRHAFLPPSLDDPISHFQLSSSKSNDRDLLEEQLDGLARRLGSAEHPPLTPQYRFVDLHTLHARIQLHPSASSSSSLALVFLFEPDKGWRFLELPFSSTSLSTSSESSGLTAWSDDLPSVVEQGQQRLDAEQQKSSDSMNEEGEGAVGAEEDPSGFWDGFSDEEEEKAATGAEQAAAPLFSPRVEDGDDYWSSYARVDDAIMPSNPSSPIPTKRAEAWGTGGETPVGWTPDTRTPAAGIVSPHESESESSGDTEGSMPNFPPPLFKGATPAISPHQTHSNLPSLQNVDPSLLTPPLTPSSASSSPLHLALRGLLQMHVRSSSDSPAHSTVAFLEAARLVAAESLQREAREAVEKA